MMDGLTTDKVNGCGACKGFWSFIKPPHRKFFKDDCNCHDKAYEVGGTQRDRKLADKKLFFDMVYRSVDHFRDRKVTSMWWFVTTAFLYYLGVRLVGGISSWKFK